ncbi:putative oxidoreductase C-terminal domain-containing protein [Sphingobacterium spiritivorum]|uniref:putative oxidoreductase C-terminal domain-containing protein n=1 Tax=Sphingobacterium spiritivorum TaxID=258 RepID=UPI003DA22B03
MKHFFKNIAFLVLLTGMMSCQEQSHIALVVINPMDSTVNTVVSSMADQLDTLVTVFNPSHSPSLTANPAFRVADIQTTDVIGKLLSGSKANVAYLDGFNTERGMLGERLTANGIAVLAQQPLVAGKQSMQHLQNMYRTAAETKALIYDLVPARFYEEAVIVKALVAQQEFSGGLIAGSEEAPAIVINRHFNFVEWKQGDMIQKPLSFFDVNKQGDGFAGLASYLDLVNWITLPEQKLDYAADVRLIKARKWPALLNRYQFANLTGQQSYPDELKAYVNPYNELAVSSNAEIRYLLRGKSVAVTVAWDYDSEESKGDTFEGVLQTINFTVEVRSEDRRNIIYITAKESADKPGFEKKLQETLAKTGIQAVNFELTADGKYKIVLPEGNNRNPDKYLASSVKAFVSYYQKGAVPEWETSFIKAKYQLISDAAKQVTP